MAHDKRKYHPTPRADDAGAVGADDWIAIKNGSDGTVPTPEPAPVHHRTPQPEIPHDEEDI